jgi:hypothetical protein
MNNSVKYVLLSFSLTIVLLLPQSTAGQATIKLENGPNKKTSKHEADAASKIVKPLGQADEHRPIVLVLPQVETSSPSTESAKRTNQATDALVQSPTSCSWTFLLLNEVGTYWLILSNVGCLGCNIGTDLSQTTPGILGFSHSPSGPWTETLTVYTQLDFSGNGTSETFYIKGQSSGASTFHAQNFWSSFNIDFQVAPCSCPEIPIVP